MSTQTHDADVRKVAELIDGERIGMLTTLGEDGTLTSRPMALQEVEFDGDLWFFAQRDSSLVSHIAAQPGVNVAISSASTWVSLAGTASVVVDVAKKKDLWNAGVAAWFPEGPESDEIVLVKVDADSAEYWDTPGGRIASLISFAKAKVTGERYSGGENDTVQM